MYEDGISIYEQLTEDMKNQILDLDTTELTPEKINNTTHKLAIFIVDRFLDLLIQTTDWVEMQREYYKPKSEPILKIQKRKNIFSKKKV